MLGPTNILVPIDFSSTSDAALRYGRELAATFGATLHVLHAVGDAVTLGAVPPAYGPELGTVVVELEADARARLREWLSREARNAEVPTRDVVITSMSPANAILTYANDQAIDLIVMGTHGRGAVAHFLLGGVTDSVVRSAPCPVLTVRHVERDWKELPALRPAARPRAARASAAAGTRSRKRTVA
jgi:nucleotide-binding universal stress UspA family protein